MILGVIIHYGALGMCGSCGDFILCHDPRVDQSMLMLRTLFRWFRNRSPAEQSVLSTLLKRMSLKLMFPKFKKFHSKLCSCRNSAWPPTDYHRPSLVSMSNSRKMASTSKTTTWSDGMNQIRIIQGIGAFGQKLITIR